MMVAQWVINSLTMDDRCQIMKDFSKFNTNGTNYVGSMLIHHILSFINTMTRSVIINVKNQPVKDENERL